MYLIDTSEEITPTLKGYVQEALSELSRLTHIARQSLGFYRELTGPQRFDLNDSVDDTLNIYLKTLRWPSTSHVERRYAPGKLEIELRGVKGESPSGHLEPPRQRLRRTARGRYVAYRNRAPASTGGRCPAQSNPARDRRRPPAFRRRRSRASSNRSSQPSKAPHRPGTMGFGYDRDQARRHHRSDDTHRWFRTWHNL